MTRGEIQVFLASIHAISNDLSKAKDVPASVFAELSAMESLLKKEWEVNPKAMFR